MIKSKDVVTLRIPFPNISSDLAVISHMYICYDSKGGIKKLIKSQTFKKRMITKNLLNHYVITLPDINRNPFIVKTLIDCDKLFNVSVKIPTTLLTKSRRDICDDLYKDVEEELFADGYISEHIDSSELVSINHKINSPC